MISHLRSRLSVFIAFVCVVCVSCGVVQPNHHTKKPADGEKVPIKFAAQHFPLSQVKLLPGTFYASQQDTTLQYLRNLDADRLLYNFRQTANLTTGTATPYGGWEDPTCQLRGHFVGHYMSATAFMGATTGAADIKTKAEYLVAGIAECQQIIGTGYVSAFPSTEFDLLENHQPVWAPYYTIHKLMAGLYDHYIAFSNPTALTILKGMASYFYGRIKNVLATQGMQGWQDVLEVEWGGMNEVMYNLYSITQDPDHLAMANLFDHYNWTRPLLAGADALPGEHANTHIPEIIGEQRGYEVTGNSSQLRIAANFFEHLTANHSWVTGGSNTGEWWFPGNKMGTQLSLVTEESCTQYNILKVARHFFEQTGDSAYMDFYERAITNGVLGNQKFGEPGRYIYMLPLGGSGLTKGANGHIHDKVDWGSPYNDFWCCYGTMMESFSKLPDSIFFTTSDNKTLYIVQYTPSELTWTQGGFKITLNSGWPTEFSGNVSLSSLTAAQAAKKFTLKLRIPIWATEPHVYLNGKHVTEHFKAGEFLTIEREWNHGDLLTFTYVAQSNLVYVRDDRPLFEHTFAIMNGPLVLAALTSGPVELDVNGTIAGSWLVRDPIPVADNISVTFTAKGPFNEYTLVPLHELFTVNQKYAVYFNQPELPVALQAEIKSQQAIIEMGEAKRYRQGAWPKRPAEKKAAEESEVAVDAKTKAKREREQKIRNHAQDLTSKKQLPAYVPKTMRH